MSDHDITVAIATMGPRIDDLILPPRKAGLRYVIMVQRPPVRLPDSHRPDVTFVPLDSIGLSHSRNAALAFCKTPFLVFADDDMSLDLEGLQGLAHQMILDPRLDFAAGWRAGKMPSAGPRAGRHLLRKLNSGRICAPELMVRTATVREAGILFDANFGIGAPNPVGEDYIFVCDMLDAGLRGEGFPIVTGRHPEASTGEVWNDPGVLKARRKVLARCFGATALVISAIYAMRHRKRLGGWPNAWRFWKG